MYCLLHFLSRVPDQNGVARAWYIVEIHHSGQEPSLCFPSSTLLIVHQAMLLSTLPLLISEIAKTACMDAKLTRVTSPSYLVSVDVLHNSEGVFLCSYQKQRAVWWSRMVGRTVTYCRLPWGTRWKYKTKGMLLLFVGCLTSQQQASVCQGRICTDNLRCCHTEIEVADQTFHLTQSQYTDTGPTSPSADPITPGAWQGIHWSANV